MLETSSLVIIFFSKTFLCTCIQTCFSQSSLLRNWCLQMRPFCFWSPMIAQYVLFKVFVWFSRQCYDFLLINRLQWSILSSCLNCYFCVIQWHHSEMNVTWINQVRTVKCPSLITQNNFLQCSYDIYQCHVRAFVQPWCTMLLVSFT